MVHNIFVIYYYYYSIATPNVHDDSNCKTLHMGQNANLKWHLSLKTILELFIRHFKPIAKYNESVGNHQFDANN